MRLDCTLWSLGLERFQISQLGTTPKISRTINVLQREKLE
jgi:hypothetical protein